MLSEIIKSNLPHCEFDCLNQNIDSFNNTNNNVLLLLILKQLIYVECKNELL